MRVLKLLTILTLIATHYSLAQSSASREVREGTRFVASVDRSIRASHCRAGDRVNFRVAQPFLLGGEVVPQGARVTGHVVVARKLDKKAKQDSLLAVVADTISWKKESIPVAAWIVGFGAVNFSASDANDRALRRFDRTARAKMSETTDRPAAFGRKRTPAAFNNFDSMGQITKYDPAGYIRDLRVMRRPDKSIGTLLVHDDGDIYLPKTLLVMMEQISVTDAPE